MNDRSCFHYIHDGQTTRWGPRRNMLLLPRFGTHKPLECGVWSCLKDLQPHSQTDRTIKHDLIKPTLSPHVGFLFDLMFLKALLREGHLPLADERGWCVAKKSQRLPLAYKKAQHEGFRRCCLNAVPGWAYCFKKHNHRKSTRITMLSSKLKAPWTVPSMGNSAHHSFNLANYALRESLKIHDRFLIFSNPLPKVLTKSGPSHVLGQDRTPCTGNEARTCLQPEKQCNLSQEWDRFTWTMTRRLCSHCGPQKRTAAWSEPVGRTLNSFLKAIFNART